MPQRRPTKPLASSSVHRQPRTYQRSTLPYLDSTNVVKKLNAEWEQIQGQPATWAGSSGTLADILASIAANPDQILLGLLQAGQDGHALAGRTVLQAFLGKMVLLSHAHPQIDLADLVAVLWLRIAAYPTDRRPQAVAANLALDVLNETLKSDRPLGYLADVPPNDLTAQAVLDAARALGLASPAALDVVAAMYSPEGGSRRVAEQFQISPDAVRRRCCDTIARLRRQRDLLCEYLDL